MSTEVKVTIKYGNGHAEPWIVLTGSEKEVTDTLQRFVSLGDLDSLVRKAAMLAFQEEYVVRNLDAEEVPIETVTEEDEDDTAEDETETSLVEQFAACDDVDELRALYTAHRSEIEGDADIKRALNARVAELKA